MADLTTSIILIEQGFALDGPHRAALAANGSPVIACPTLDDAIARLAVVQPRVVVLCALPSSDLPEQLMTLLAARTSPARAIWLTRRAQTRDALRALRLGFCDYHTCSEPAEALNAAVQRALELLANNTHDATADHEMLVSLVSHEIRNPLMTINGYLELLKKYRGRLPEEKMSDYLDRSLMAMDEVTYLADLLAETVRMDAGHELPATEPVVLAELVEGCLTQCARLAQRHTLAADVPRTLQVQAEPMALRQIIRNLVINAIKYSPEGGTITIRATKSTEHMVVVEVQDEGIGIAPEQLPRLFARFARVHDVRRWPGIRGTGLGLYLCRHLVEAQGGRIWVNSTPGLGSVFAFTVPLARRAARLIAVNRSPARSAS